MGAKTKDGLTQRQEAFVLAYLKCGNASQAYREAFAPPNMSDQVVWNKASKLLKRGEVGVRLAALREKAAEKASLTVERTLQEVARLAYFDKRKLFKADGSIKRPLEWDDDTAAAVAGVEVDEIKVGGEVVGHTVKVKTWDKNSALDKAMKHWGLYEKDNDQSRTMVVPTLHFHPVRAEKVR